MRKLAEPKRSGTDVVLGQAGEEASAQVHGRRRWRPTSLVTIVGTVVGVGAIAVTAAVMSSDPGNKDNASGASSADHNYTPAEVTAACDELIRANGEPTSETPDVTVCVGRGSDDHHIEGLSVAIAPDVYSSLSTDERAAVARAFSDSAGMPVSLKAGEAPNPT